DSVGGNSELRCVFSLPCSYVLLELVETERDYVRDLGLVVEVRLSGSCSVCVRMHVCEGVCVRVSSYACLRGCLCPCVFVCMSTCVLVVSWSLACFSLMGPQGLLWQVLARQIFSQPESYSRSEEKKIHHINWNNTPENRHHTTEQHAKLQDTTSKHVDIHINSVVH